MPTVIVQKWEESERGWGTRPDGFSLHLDTDDRMKFIAEHWASQPDGRYAPDEYSRPDGTPYEAEVDDATYEKVKASGNGTRHHAGEPYPGDGGKEGWLPAER